MEDLTKTEEPVMQVLWELKQAFIKDIIDQLPGHSNPPYNTISSVVRTLARKGFVGFKAYGKTHEYFPLISKAQYRASTVRRMLVNYFDNSPAALVTYLVDDSLETNKI